MPSDSAHAADHLRALRAERDSYAARFAAACRAAQTAGLSITDIARHAGVGRPAVYRALQRHQEAA